MIELPGDASTSTSHGLSGHDRHELRRKRRRLSELGEWNDPPRGRDRLGERPRGVLRVPSSGPARRPVSSPRTGSGSSAVWPPTCSCSGWRGSTSSTWTASRSRARSRTTSATRSRCTTHRSVPTSPSTRPAWCSSGRSSSRRSTRASGCFDFLRGDEAYKKRFGPTPRAGVRGASSRQAVSHGTVRLTSHVGLMSRRRSVPPYVAPRARRVRRRRWHERVHPRGRRRDGASRRPIRHLHAARPIRTSRTSASCVPVSGSISIKAGPQRPVHKDLLRTSRPALRRRRRRPTDRTTSSTRTTGCRQSPARS